MLKEPLELPRTLEPYRRNIEESIEPYVHIQSSEKLCGITDSKFGGYPYLPRNIKYPKDSHGQYMSLLAQLNFAEIPHLKEMPDTGILQIYLSNKGGNELDYEDPFSQKNYRLIYHSTAEQEGVDDFSFLYSAGHEGKYKLLEERRMTFEMRFAPVSMEDYRFEEVVASENEELEIEQFYQEYEECFPGTGHKIGGYPFFVQSDPREYELRFQDYSILLFQAETGRELPVMDGERGILNFFIKPSDLKARDFGHVLYNWGCCL